MRSKLPLAPAAVYALVKEVRVEGGAGRPLAVGGARELATALRRELVRGGEPGAVVDLGLPADAAGVVYVLAGAPSDDDVRALRDAETSGAPVICLAPQDVAAGPVPHVLATDVVAIRAGAGFPLDELARALALRLGEHATPLAARLPVLRPAVCRELIERAARRNALLGAAVFVPGVDFPVLTLNQLRLVLRIGTAYGERIDSERLPEVATVIAGALGFRAAARQLLVAVPVAGWLVKGAVAYAGTRAVGEAATHYFSRRAGDAG